MQRNRKLSERLKVYFFSQVGHDETVLDETVLDETVLDETVLDETVLDETVLDETVLDETVLVMLRISSCCKILQVSK